VRKRTRFDIIYEILKIALERDTTKGKIIQKANINSKIASQYVTFLIENELIEEVLDKDKKIYRTTEKGKSLLSKFEDLLGAANTNIVNSS
jgi:predicted transcriptional regulator